VQECASTLPSVSVEVFEATNPIVIEWAQEDEIDLGIVHYLDESPSGLACDALNDDHAVLVTGTDCATPSQDAVPLCEAVRYPLAMPALPHKLRETIEASARKRGLEINLQFEMRSLPVIIELVERNISCSILPLSAVAGRAADGRVKAFKIIDPPVQASMSLIYAARRPLASAAISVRSAIAEAAKVNIESREHIHRRNANGHARARRHRAARHHGGVHPVAST
jgi:LysR family nitrogen assimilation transcriptional regulator